MSAAARPPVENLSGLLDRLCALVDCEAPAAAGADGREVHVRDLLEAIGRRAYGPLLLAVGLFAISPLTLLPGLNVATAVLTLIIALQLAVGLQRPWLPRAMLEVTVPRKLLVEAVAAMRPWAERVDMVLRPRFAFLTFAPFVNIVGLVVAAAALVTIPLSFVPLGPLLPGLAVVFIALGLAAKDGLLLALGAGATAGAGWLMARTAGFLLDQAVALWPG